ncbi:hypothetical protein EJ08DRAFT_20378 [Tothia fuscella]|uniref:Uncharacterized protein n=1 Tax=Tothia fuscella TaxID=1048955 RepID=A0A9P4U2G2_9PEZI|nr:hypothetical protein EJ08DRAFT_20378 [Tothia fuscella]
MTSSFINSRGSNTKLPPAASAFPSSRNDSGMPSPLLSSFPKRKLGSIFGSMSDKDSDDDNSVRGGKKMRKDEIATAESRAPISLKRKLELEAQGIYGSKPISSEKGRQRKLALQNPDEIDFDAAVRVPIEIGDQHREYEADNNAADAHTIDEEEQNMGDDDDEFERQMALELSTPDLGPEEESDEASQLSDVDLSTLIPDLENHREIDDLFEEDLPESLSAASPFEIVQSSCSASVPAVSGTASLEVAFDLISDKSTPAVAQQVASKASPKSSSKDPTCSPENVPSASPTSSKAVPNKISAKDSQKTATKASVTIDPLTASNTTSKTVSKKSQKSKVTKTRSPAEISESNKSAAYALGIKTYQPTVAPLAKAAIRSDLPDRSPTIAVEAANSPSAPIDLTEDDNANTNNTEGNTALKNERNSSDSGDNRLIEEPLPCTFPITVNDIHVADCTTPGKGIKLLPGATQVPNPLDGGQTKAKIRKTAKQIITLGDKGDNCFSIRLAKEPCLKMHFEYTGTGYKHYVDGVLVGNKERKMPELKERGTNKIWESSEHMDESRLYFQWRAAVGQYLKDHSSITDLAEFPQPPPLFQCPEKVCQKSGRDRKIGACKHNMKRLFKSASNTGAEYRQIIWFEQDRWVVDRVAEGKPVVKQFEHVREDVRKEFEEVANELYEIARTLRNELNQEAEEHDKELRERNNKRW